MSLNLRHLFSHRERMPGHMCPKHAAVKRSVPAGNCGDVCGAFLFSKRLQWCISDTAGWLPNMPRIRLPLWPPAEVNLLTVNDCGCAGYQSFSMCDVFLKGLSDYIPYGCSWYRGPLIHNPLCNTPFTSRSRVWPGIFNIGQSRMGPSLYRNKYPGLFWVELCWCNLFTLAHDPGPTLVDP